MKDTERMKLIDNIDSKLKILYKNMTKDEYYDFINNNREIKVYNDLLNNITLNNLPIIYIKFLPMNVLLSINSLVYDKLCLFMDNKKELVLI